MLPELGSFAIILALCFALIQSLSFYRAHTLTPFFIIFFSFGQFIFLGLGMIFLILSFLVNDLTVIYVREHSHHLLPLIYRIGAAWGGHEGSLLLWCLILSGWTFCFSIFSFRKIPFAPFAKMISVLGWISAGFILFLFGTSNPFQREFPTMPIVGNDLTPILQDPGLIFHPPMLYLGYVGFAIAFSFGLTALWEGKLDRTLAYLIRPWIILPWAFLSCGIVLGSWWAYRELGWGGWWFWDPVENASLLPWLAATALLHSLIVTEKRDNFKAWTILLCLLTFSLSLIGTFLVRSGVLVSVHAFASDPTRGVFLLCYLALLIGGSLLLYSYRINNFVAKISFSLFSRETLMLVNSVILICAVLTILLGTLYPIILDAFQLGKISVGEPYFNTIFVPMMLPLLLLMGAAPHTQWGIQSIKHLIKSSYLIFLMSLSLGICLPLMLGFDFHFLSSLGLTAGFWILLSTVQFALIKKNQFIQYSPMILAHLGVAILVLGVVINKTYSLEKQVKMNIGSETTLASYHFKLNNLLEEDGPNFHSLIANLTVENARGTLHSVTAEQRLYLHDQVLSKTGIIFNLWRDIYVALGNVLPDGSWTIRIYYKPFVRWIWAGGFLLLLGGILSLIKRMGKTV